MMKSIKIRASWGVMLCCWYIGTYLWSLNVRSLNVSQFCGPPRPVIGAALPFYDRNMLVLRARISVLVIDGLQAVQPEFYYWQRKGLLSTPQCPDCLWGQPCLPCSRYMRSFRRGKAAGAWSWLLTSI
jgi:hypothetical protein